jgi:hypothetical protein
MNSSIDANTNLVKLKELSDKLCLNSFEEKTDDDNNKIIASEINKIIDLEASEIDNQKDINKKVKCYEKMFHDLKIMVSQFKFC